MKYRADYVTNSSSSSFILSFKNDESIWKDLKAQFPKNIMPGWSAGQDGYFYQLYKEIKSGLRLTKNDVRELVKNEKWYIAWELEDELEEKGMSYWDVKDFLKTPEGQKQIEEACEKKFNEIMEKIGDDKVIVKVNHGDGGHGEDGALEHEILPTLDCTAVRFSHH